MATFWDDFKTSITGAADKASKKVGELTDLAKTKSALHNEEAKLKDCYEKIGRLYYAYQRCGQDNTAAIASLILEADSYKLNIQTLTEALQDLQHK